MELDERLRRALEARGPVAAASDPGRLRVELEPAGLLRAEDAFELPRAEPAFELLRAAEFEVLRAAEFEVLRAAELELLRAEPELELRRLELAAVALLSLAAARLRSPAFGEALCFVLVCLATSRPLYGRCNEAHVPCNIDCGGPHIGGATDRRDHSRIRRTPGVIDRVSGSVSFVNAARTVLCRAPVAYARARRPVLRLSQTVPPLGSDGRRSRFRLAAELRPGGAGGLIVIENRRAGEPVVPATPLG